VRLFSADALRWTLIAGSSLGADVILDPDDLESTFAPGRNFANKLWNIGRFVLAQLPEKVTVTDQFDRATLTLADRWILSRLQATIRDVTASFEQFRLDEGAKQCFEFVWKELADWYVEAVKPRLAFGPDEGAAAQAVLTYCFDTALRLLHPVVPFITEELWQKLPGRKPDELLAVARWPEVHPDVVDAAAERNFTRIQAGITAARNIRAEYKVPPKVRTIFYINPASDEARQTFEAERDVIAVMSGSARAIIGPPPNAPGGSTVLPDGSTAFLQLEGFIDVSQECRRLSTERERLDQQLTGLAAKLSNQHFVARAPTEVVAREREKEREWRFQRDVLDGKLKSLGCS
jgi:valyl-tRNA synthetase